jgi:hypothetical protein
MPGEMTLSSWDCGEWDVLAEARKGILELCRYLPLDKKA